MSEQRTNYDSHKWTTTKDLDCDGEFEYHTYCIVCGVPDIGDPDEFDHNYPHCNDLVEP